ncbi:hypothetical protein [Pseudooceanicola nanhaiensis]|uniref:hypothetical protein n=1 Tax=Pseudooceanicola nanhaiensis TaxID=375761 RepID=UPI001CD2D21C|nr:hypothetical protein [Pseudooceanicola nanhaiensis]MCA0921047.1 hypothetical protein [Pseudooceanicola nanhaiensis]
MLRAALISTAALAACTAADTGAEVARAAAPAGSASYEGIETRLLDGDLVSFHVKMRGARGEADVSRYAECAAAQYALIRGYGFARHVRTNVAENTGLWQADAVYTISASLPRGLSTIDAEVVAASCAENGIPMV